MSELIDLETTEDVSREEAAAILHKLADDLARHNDLELVRDGLQFRVKVPDTVTVELEIEIGTDGGEIEVEIRW